MKRIKSLIIFVIGLIALPLTVNAAGASINIKTSGQAVVGNTITATVTVSSSTPMGSWQFLVNYDSSKLKLVSGQTSVADYTKSTSGTKSQSYTLKFQALSSGNASINVGSYLVYDNNEGQMSVSTGNTSVKLLTQAELEATYSKDNNLKGLAVEGYEITPEFNKDTLEYTASVPSTVDKINIIATKNDTKASVEGDGEKEVVEGANSFEIVVTAQNGATKTYKLVVTVEDTNPIEVNLEGKKYTVVKRKDNLEIPVGFEETTLTINEIEVPAFKNEALDITVVGIKDEEGNIFYASCDNGNYTLYREIKSNNLILYLLDLKELKGYSKEKININGYEIDAYKLSENSDYYIVYGKNIETGKESYYLYDSIEKTFQRYNDEEIKSLNKQLQNYLYVIYVFSGCIGLIVLCFIIYLIGKNKAKKKYKKLKELQENKNEEIIESILEEKKKNNK